MCVCVCVCVCVPRLRVTCASCLTLVRVSICVSVCACDALDQIRHRPGGSPDVDRNRIPAIVIPVRRIEQGKERAGIVVAIAPIGERVLWCKTA